ncbi:MAG TPA: hypothetical protein IAA76_08660 [Candidatus Ornithospirochaeta stercorigallinarum]|nr:hypothetical protein [Candidatus Ornithospirochaeta stercorigallinarum]
MSRNEKLDCLKKLQVILQKKFVLEDKINSIPADLKAEEAQLRSAQEKYQNLSDFFDSLQSEQKSLAIKYDDAFNKRIEYEKQMEFINTQREFEALTKQLEEARISEQSFLKMRNSKTAELEKVKTDLEAEKVELDALEERVREEKGKVDSEISSINEEIATLDAECDSIKAGVIPEDLYEKFSNIVKKKDGFGIVPVYGQVCTGCDLILPVQFVIDLELKTEKGEIEYCPYCSRIIYKETLDDDVERSYTFEQLESQKSESKSSSQDESASGESDNYDESMGMDEEFEDF